MKNFGLTAVFIAFFALPSFARAEDAPQCNQNNAGLLHCIAFTSCECKLFQPSLLKGDQGGYRWDCGILRPKCVDPNKISDQENRKPYDGPDLMILQK